MFLDYKHLFDASRTARYLINQQGKSAFSTFSDYMDADKVKTLLSKRLFGFEQKAMGWLTGHTKSDLRKFDKALIS